MLRIVSRRVMSKKIYYFILLLTIVLAVCACAKAPLPGTVADSASSDSTGNTEVRIIATQNFGKELLFDKTVPVSGNIDALQALNEAAEVETAYGGGFVNGIGNINSKYQGIKSVPMDWFFYINGIMANTGALEYTLQDGDIEHWDYHNWGFQRANPAIIAGFPTTFRYGYGGNVNPTIIAWDGEYQEEALRLEKELRDSGVIAISSKESVELSKEEKESAHLIIIGSTENGLVSELNQQWRRLGFWAYFENGKLVTLGSDGKTGPIYGAGTGLIQATQNPWNPDGTGVCENTTWMISGTDKTGVKSAVDILLKSDDTLKYAFAAVIENRKVIRLP